MFGLLMSAVAVALVSTICAMGIRSRPSPPDAVNWSRRLVFALPGTAILALVGGFVAGVVTGGRPRQVELTEILLVVSSVVWLPLTRRWNARAHLCWSMSVYLYVGYLVALAGLGGIAAALMHARSLGGALTAALLVLPTWVFAGAPRNSLSARRAAQRAPDSRPDIRVPAQTGQAG